MHIILIDQQDPTKVTEACISRETGCAILVRGGSAEQMQALLTTLRAMKVPRLVSCATRESIEACKLFAEGRVWSYNVSTWEVIL